MKREFPLVALVLIAISIGSGILALNYTSRAITLTSSQEKLRLSYSDNEPLIYGEQGTLLVRDSDGYGFDYYFRSIPGPAPLESPWDSGATKELPKDTLYNEDTLPKDQKLISKIQIGDTYYKYDLETTISKQEELELGKNGNISEVKDGRTTWLVAFYAPKAITALAIAIVSLALAIALFTSYKQGYITNKNILLVKLAAFAIGAALMSYFVAKGIFLYDTMYQGYHSSDLVQDLLISSIMPTLLILAAVIGLTHLVCQNMRNTISLKEEVDGTV